MCGLFAYTGPARPDHALLAAAATAAAARGPHGHGWATHPGQIVHRAHGPMNTDRLAHVDAPRIVGHARLATRGDYRDPAGLQPAHADGHYLAHNGTIRNHTELDPTAATDTLALVHAYARHRAHHGPQAALRAALEDADTPAWALLVLDATGTLLAWRHDLPLWRLNHPTGRYYASRRFHPDAEPLADDDLSAEETTAP